MAGMAETHESIRALMIAARDHRTSEKMYTDSPTDANATYYHESWIALRKAVDALVALPVADSSEQVALATRWTFRAEPVTWTTGSGGTTDAKADAGDPPSEAPPADNKV